MRDKPRTRALICTRLSLLEKTASHKIDNPQMNKDRTLRLAQLGPSGKCERSLQLQDPLRELLCAAACWKMPTRLSQKAARLADRAKRLCYKNPYVANRSAGSPWDTQRVNRRTALWISTTTATSSWISRAARALPMQDYWRTGKNDIVGLTGLAEMQLCASCRAAKIALLQRTMWHLSVIS